MSESETNLTPRPEQKTKRELFKLFKTHNRGFTAAEATRIIEVNVSKRHIRSELVDMAENGLLQRLEGEGKWGADIFKRANKLRRIESYRAHDVNLYRSRGGYNVIHHHHKGQKHMVPVHRLVAVAKFGIDAAKEAEIHHKNKHPKDNSPENLTPLPKGLHKKADVLATIRLSTTDDEFEKLLKLSKSVVSED